MVIELDIPKEKLINDLEYAIEVTENYSKDPELVPELEAVTETLYKILEKIKEYEN